MQGKATNCHMLLNMFKEIKVWNAHQQEINLIKFRPNFNKVRTTEASFRNQKTKFNFPSQISTKTSSN